MNINKKTIIAGASAIVGNVVILLASHLLSKKPPPSSHEYLISETLIQNYNVFTIGAIALCAGVVSYLTGVRPFIVSLFMVVIFPIVAIYEGITYPSSHNLLPIELIMYFIMGVPSFIGALIGYKLLKKHEGTQQTAAENLRQ